MQPGLKKAFLPTIDEDLAAIREWASSSVGEDEGVSSYHVAYRGKLQALCLSRERKGWHYWSASTDYVGPYATRDEAGEALFEVVRRDAMMWKRTRDAARINARYHTLQLDLEALG